jgi:hypothetical protein
MSNISSILSKLPTLGCNPMNVVQVCGSTAPTILSNGNNPIQLGSISGYNINPPVPYFILESEYIVKQEDTICYFKIDNDEFKIICESKLFVIFNDEIYIFEQNNRDIINEVKKIIKIKKL